MSAFYLTNSGMVTKLNMFENYFNPDAVLYIIGKALQPTTA